nr:hypothetical protein HmN_000645100 [Hymenolepis microstoma]
MLLHNCTQHGNVPRRRQRKEKLVNSLQPLSNSFRKSNDSLHSTLAQNPTRQPVPSIGGRRIPGTKDVGGAVKSVFLIPPFTSMDSSLIRNMDSHLVGGQRSTASLFVFYVKDGQTSLTDVIVNMSIPSLHSGGKSSRIHSEHPISATVPHAIEFVNTLNGDANVQMEAFTHATEVSVESSPPILESVEIYAV